MWLAPRMDQDDKTLQTTFGLPPHEVMIENFSCAVKRRILLHGRMFISAEHVCFRSDIFGLKTNIVIPMRDIVTIRRTVTDFINPSVEITTSLDRHVFASLIFREHTFEIISELLRIQRLYEEIASPRSQCQETGQPPRAAGSTQTPAHHAPSPLSGAACTADALVAAPASPSIHFALSPPAFPNAPAEAPPRFRPRALWPDSAVLQSTRTHMQGATPPSARACSPRGDASAAARANGSVAAEWAGARDVPSPPRPPPPPLRERASSPAGSTASFLPRSPDDEGPGGASAEQEGPEEGPGAASPARGLGGLFLRRRRPAAAPSPSAAPAPQPGAARDPQPGGAGREPAPSSPWGSAGAPVDASARVDEGASSLSSEPLPHEIFSTSLPCSAAVACERLFGANSAFFCEFLAAQGGSEIEVEPWAALRGGGLLRELRRKQRVRSRFSPVRQTRVHETQWLGSSSDGAVVLAVHQLSLDVPYGDYFAVHTKLCLRDESAPQTGLVAATPTARLVVSVDVVFCKPTLVQSRITAGALAELRHAYHEAALPAMRRFLEEAEPVGGGEARLQAVSAAAGGAEGEGGDEASAAMRGRGPAWAALAAALLEPLAASRRARARMRIALLGLRCARGRAALARALGLAAARLVAWAALVWLLSWLVHGGLGRSVRLGGRTRDDAEAELRARLSCLEDAYAALRARTSAFEACSRAAAALGGQQRRPPAECLRLPAAEPWLGAAEACMPPSRLRRISELIS